MGVVVVWGDTLSCFFFFPVSLQANNVRLRETGECLHLTCT